jgi:hypothetical protein
MNIYLIERTDCCDYDEFDSAVVCAEDEESARDRHPNGSQVDWAALPKWGTWVTSRDMVTVRLVGVAAPFSVAGVILSSFNAG